MSKLIFSSKKSDIKKFSIKELRPFDILIIDSKIKKLYKDQLPQNINFISISAKEKNKSIQYLEKLAIQCLKKGANRNSRFIAIGGGIIGDLVGFLASIYMRGCEWINIPTTYLSQIDSAHGGKTAVNLDQYKNILGSFHEPKKVYINSSFLKTLPEREIISGKGEEFKYSLISNIKFQEKIDLSNIKKLIKIKQKFYLDDVMDRGKRTFLNYGHTLAHALEKIEGEKKWKHGEAVFRGCHFNLFLEGKYQELPYKIPKIKAQNINMIIKAMKYDKKGLKFILRDNKGLITKQFNQKEIKQYLNEYISKQ